MKNSLFVIKNIRYFIMIFFVFSFLNSFSINTKGINDNNQDLTSTEWKIYTEKTGIQIYYRTIDCNDATNDIHQQFIILKFVNTSNTDLIVDWEMLLWYNDECRTCNSGSEYLYTVTIPAGESSEGDCFAPRELKLFSSFLNYDHIPKLSKFEFAGLNVTPK